MSARHTPGPWHATASCEGLPLTRIGYAMRGVGGGYDSHCIALLSVSQGSDEQTNANARLIAAAPELLEALQALHAICRDCDLEEGQQERPTEEQYVAAMERAEAAIAAATGSAT